MRTLLFPLVALSALAGAQVDAAEAMPVAFEGCTDPMNGQPIPSVASTAIGDIAMAIRNPRPLIVYNPRVSNSVSPQTRVFFYWHECAHHQLGHTLGSGHPRMNEQMADCWAIRALAPGMSPYDFQVIQRDIAMAGRGDATHDPGPIRAQKLAQCLG